jgi:hypothetical protein
VVALGLVTHHADAERPDELADLLDAEPRDEAATR